MARQNRVTPASDIIAHPARGLFFGNRGCLHDDQGRIRRPWATKLWICCLLRFKERRRPLLRPGRFTELFFLDEAVALAAGHRPCAECRRADYNRFRAGWVAAGLGPSPPRAPEMDSLLHAARRDGQGRQRRHGAALAGLPDGVFISGGDGEALLVLGDRLFPYDPAGYLPPLPRPAAAEVAVLTPAPIVAILGAGYRAEIHPTAR